MLRASVSGAIDFKACKQTRRWWSGAFLKLRAVEEELHLRYLEVSTQRAIGVQGMPDLGQDAEKRQTYAIDAVKRFRHEAMPWFGASEGQNRGSDPVDAIALWYSVFGHDADLVKEMKRG